MRKLVLLVLCIALTASQLWAQTRTITGRVTDDKGAPLAGATVSVPNSNTRTATKTDGTFSINVPANARSLTVSYVGFAEYSAPITANSTTINVSLTAASDLEGVVVTGISRVKRSEYSGAVTKLISKEIEDRPVGSFDQLLQGRAPGVTSLTGSGAPGSASTIIIRGQGSITGGFTPLYIVDGIPVEASVFQGFNPNDFESIDILRDASASALYGSRGSAGVIVVTTKRGRGEKMTLSYGAQVGVKSRPEFTWDMMTTPELLKAQEDYGRVLGLTPGQSPAIPGWFYSKNNPAYATLSAAQQSQYDRALDSISKINTNWRDVWFRDGSFQNHQLTLSGGAGKTKLYSSLAYYSEEGTTYRSNMQRVTWRNNVDFADEKFTFSVSSNLGYTKRNFQQSTTNANLGNPFLVANISSPYSKLYDESGKIITGVGPLYAGNNTWELTQLDQNYSDQFKVTLGIQTAYRITNTITAALTTGIDFRETQTSNYGSRLAFTRRNSTSLTGQAGFQSEALTRFLTGNIRPSLSYRNVFKEKHDVDVSVYGEYVQQYSKAMNLQGFGIDPRTPNTPAAITQGNGANQLFAVVGGGRSENAIVSALAIAKYTYNGKYTVNGSFRRDGSSKLPEVNRWTSFWSVGLTWDAIKEDFIRSAAWINTLRVKLSYGGSGNHDNIAGGDYPYQSTYGVGAYGGLNTQVATYPGNDDFQWETTWTTNLGIDFGFLKNRIWGDINLYDKRTKDLFVQKTLSATSGFGSLNINAGELQNKGVEFSGNADVIRNRNLTWTINGNVSYNRNKVLDLGGEPSFEAGTELITVGLPLGSHYEVKWGGVSAATGEPLFYDANGKLTTDFNSAPAVQEFGTWEAPWRGGFGTTVRYKGFEVSTLFSWQKGANKYDNLQYFMENPNGFLAFGYNQANTLKFWQKPGDNSTSESPRYTTSFSSRFIRSADFLRWRDLTVSFNMPQNILERTKFISRARFFVQGTNLLIWTKWQGMDPEAGATNLNLNEFPNPRAVTVGLDISF
jgi:TonB-linked SusC/RagA family outer membrane protein